MNRLWPVTLIASCAFATSIYAAPIQGIQLDRTRVVIQDGQTESLVGVGSTLSVPSLVKTSFEALDGTPTDNFIAVPPLYRLESNQANRIRILTVKALPTDRESVFYVKVVAYPGEKESGNSLRYGIGQRIKLFYRPKGIDYDCKAAVEHLNWRFDRQTLTVNNPTKLSVSMTELQVGNQKIEATMVLPGYKDPCIQLRKGGCF